MPKGVVKTKRDEAAWTKAKGIIHKQYPNMSEDNDSFWKLVQTVYQNMTKALNPLNHTLLHKAAELTFLCPEMPKDPRTFTLDTYYLLFSHLENMEKAAHKLQGRIEIHGLDISIENRKGSVRKWYDPLKDEEGQTKMKYPYGYIRLTEGSDGDHVDVYIGDERESKNVFVIHQNNPKNGEYDEDKVMLCFKDADAAKKAYLQHYDDPKFYGSMERWGLDDFVDHVKRKKGKITGGEKLQKAVKVKTHYTKEDLAAKNLRWVTVRGNHVLVQGMADGSWVVVGGAGGKLSHFKIEKLLSEEEYKKKAKESKKVVTAELSEAQIKEQTLKRKEEVKQKKIARITYETHVKEILGVEEEDFRSKITKEEMDNLFVEAQKKVRRAKRKEELEELSTAEEEEVTKEQEKLIKKKEAEQIKIAENQAVNVLAADFLEDNIKPEEKQEFRKLMDVDAAKRILKARREFRKKIKELNIPKEREISFKVGETFAGNSKTIKDDEILQEVKAHIETQKNIQLYDSLNAQSLAIQRELDEGSIEALNGVAGDLFDSGAIFSSVTLETLGLEACTRMIAMKLHDEGRGEIAGKALENYARENNMKTVDKALKESRKRFEYADEIRTMAEDTGNGEAILSRSSANGYALRQILRGQKVLGTAVGSLRAIAHLTNSLEEKPADVVQVDMGTDLTRARKKAKKAGLKRGDYSIRTRKNRFVLEIGKKHMDKFFENNQRMREEETQVDKIKKHKENDGYIPPGIKSDIKLDPAQEAGLRFFKEKGRVLLDFEAGLGKTPIGYAAAMEAMNNMGVKKTLIVTPAKLRSQFYKERKKFLDEDQQGKVILNDKSPAERQENYKKEEGIIIIGHDQLRTDAEYIKKAGFGMMVVDEIHEMTNPELAGAVGESGKFRGMMSISKDIPFKIGMSGTNIKNSKKELYKKINFIDPDHDLGNMKDFENRYKGLNQGTNIFQESSNDAFRKEIAPWIYTQKTNLNVKNDIREVSVELTSEQKKMYKESEKKYVTEKAKGKKGAGARRDSRSYNILHNGDPNTNGKLREMIDIIDRDHIGEKAVIHTYRRKKVLPSVQTALERKYGKGCVEIIHGDTSKAQVEKAKAEFNDPESKVRFLLGTKSLETGHNLQTGTVTFHLDIPMTYAAFDQRNKRIYRKGQDKDVNTYLLRSKSPFDMSKMDIMERKEREMKILGNPRTIESQDETGFLAQLNALEAEVV